MKEYKNSSSQFKMKTQFSKMKLNRNKTQVLDTSFDCKVS